MADTDAARIGDVKGGLAAARTDAATRLKRNLTNVEATPEQAAAFRAAIGAGGGVGSGDVVGPASSTTNALAQFADASGKLLKDGPMLGAAAAGSVLRRSDGDARYLLASALGAVNGVASLGVDGKVPGAQLPASGAGGDVVGPPSATDDAPAVFSGTTGKILKGGAFPVLSVAGLTGAITGSGLKAALSLVKTDVGLASVDNTSDANKPVSTAQQAALDLKAALSDTLNSQTGTAYTLQASDNGKVVEIANASAITLTLPNNLPVGFNCVVCQAGAGAITRALGSGATLRNRNSHTKTAGQWAEISLRVRSNAGGTVAEYVMSGDTAA